MKKEGPGTGKARIRIQNTSVADPGCLSEIPDPDFLYILDPGPRIQQKQFCLPFFVGANFTKLLKLFYF